jgi:deoxyribonuclease IV
MSIAGGIHRAFDHGERAGCRTIQVFLKNSNQWRGRPLTDEDGELFRAARDRTGIQPVLAHSSYLINLASPARDLYEQSISAFAEELRRAGSLGIRFVVLHPGAHVGAGESEGLERVSLALRRLLATVDPPVGVLLENTAGQGTTLGRSFEQLAIILEKTGHSSRVGVCLDTCHLFAAGYDIGAAQGYHSTMRQFDRLIGIERIRAFHVNDSRRELGSRIDRHAHIGKGLIGIQAFMSLMSDRRFERVPKILETPKGKDLKEDRMNLKKLRQLAL